MHIIALLCLEDFGDPVKSGVVHQHPKTLFSNITFANMLVPVHAGAEFLPGVVHMNDGEPMKSDNIVKILHRLPPAIFGMNRVPGCEKVAGVDTDGHSVLLVNAVDDPTEVFEAVSHSAPLPGSCFEDGKGSEPGRPSMNRINGLRNPFDPLVFSSPHVSSRVEDESQEPQGLAPAKLVL